MTSPTLLLIHGLGATAGVWSNVIADLNWPGRVINAALPGHGSAAPSDDYTLGALAAAIADQCENGEDVVAVGHSLGGAVALCLASGFFRPVVSTAIGIGIKLAWSDADVHGMAKVAAKGVRWFDSRDEAVDRFLLSAGLRDIVNHDHPAVDHAVAQVEGRWRLTQDPNTFAQRPVDGTRLVAAAAGNVVLAAGEHDAMVSRADMAALVAVPQIAANCGHNVHVEDPTWVAALIRQSHADS